MNIKSSFIRVYALAGGLSLATVIGASGATVLTDPVGINNATVGVNEGSNAAGTPNVALTWSTVGPEGFEIYNGWPNGGGAVYQMDSAGTSDAYTVVFTPDAGFDVVLTSTGINVWDNPANLGFDIDWTVVGSTSGTLGSGSILAAEEAETTLNFGVTGTGSESLTMTLTIGATAGTGSYLAMDNLSFDQVAIPEPSTSLLAAAGLGALALRRRRK